MRRRLVAALLHLSASLAVAALAAVLVFGLWYPGAFRLMAGGRELFLLVTGVDVLIGPLLTFVVYDSRKPRKALRRDLAVIAAIQLAALAYGLHTVYIARPVAMVFEVDRLRMVTASDVHEAELPKAPPELRRLPVTGPWLIAARRPEPGTERNDALFMGVSGVDIGQRPLFWQPYETALDRVLERSRPIALLLGRYPQQAAAIRAGLEDMHADEATSRFLPVMARGDFVAVLDPTGHVLGYLPFDGFF